MHRNTDIGKVNQPEWFIETEAGEEIARCIETECSVAGTTAEYIEQSCGGDSN